MPIIHWLESQAAESLQHTRQAGEMITHIGGQPSLKVGRLVDKAHNSIRDILRDALEHERGAMKLYRELLAREIEKMLRHPGN